MYHASDVHLIQLVILFLIGWICYKVNEIHRAVILWEVFLEKVVEQLGKEETDAKVSQETSGD